MTAHLLTRRSASVNICRSTSRLSLSNGPTHQIGPLQAHNGAPMLKFALKGRLFHTIDEIEENSLRDLHVVPQDAFQNWKNLWKWCIDSGEEYFEGDESSEAVSFQ
jgi:hypothetical protein